MYTVNLSKVKNYSRRKRAKKAMALLREQVEKREDGEISIDPEINHELWKDGVENPPKTLDVEVVEQGDKKVVKLADSGREEQQQETQDTSSETEEEAGDDRDEEYREALDGTVSEAKEAIKDLDDPDHDRLLELEKQGKDRKTLKEFLE